MATDQGKRKPERRPLAERVADGAFEESPLPTYPESFTREDGTVVTNAELQERDRRLFPRARRRDDD